MKVYQFSTSPHINIDMIWQVFNALSLNPSHSQNLPERLLMLKFIEFECLIKEKEIQAKHEQD